METPAGICHGCQTLVDKMASPTDGNFHPFEPTFLLTGSETTPCSLCSLLENMANAHGYSTSDECLRKAYKSYRDTIFCYFPWNNTIVLKFTQLSGKYAKITASLLWRSLTLKLTDVATTEYVKEHGESIGNARTSSSCSGSLESLALPKASWTTVFSIIKTALSIPSMAIRRGGGGLPGYLI